ncbi:MAG: methyltransferase domain-containing protein [Thermoguttaceae bacterium]|nr:methyltransferase domain-containing protein [Thermoguttaceae bacterium]MDW8038750.1 methyltransferase domain-containing protein [Thermoguttaceae bacterium]
MKGLVREYLVFWQEVWRAYHTTGAILPSSRALGRALARYVGRQKNAQWILEVGPGTGAVTRWILTRMRPEDRLDLVEINERFVAQLQQRFMAEAPFDRFQAQVRIFHTPVQQMPETQPYDLVISGLPLNNFQVSEVQAILQKMTALLRPGGVLSFFEYMGIRRLRGLVAGRADRQRLQGIERMFRELFQRAEIRRDWVWLNVPPAWVHHLQPVANPSGAFTPSL